MEGRIRLVHELSIDLCFSSANCYCLIAVNIDPFVIQYIETIHAHTTRVDQKSKLAGFVLELVGGDMQRGGLQRNGEL